MLISKNFLTREASYKPSYLISWSQSEPLGTALPEVGRQNSMGMGRHLAQTCRNASQSSSRMFIAL